MHTLKLFILAVVCAAATIKARTMPQKSFASTSRADVVAVDAQAAAAALPLRSLLQAKQQGENFS
jgi:hypothetical protein